MTTLKIASFRPLLWLLAWTCLVQGGRAEPARDSIEPKMSWLDNGTIRLGVDLSIGGAITYLAESDKKVNMINSHDWGRQIQMSFYSGPNPFVPEGAEVRPAWKQLGWNPIQSGDCYDYPSETVTHTNDGSEIYVKCIPKHWPLKNTPGQCEFECWFRLVGNTVVARSRITNHRDDKTQYPGRSQELPAIYTNGPWFKLVTYLGDAPFTGAAPTVVVGKDDGKGWPWRTFATPEHWAALLDENDRGLGIHLPGACAFSGGFAGRGKGAGGPKDTQTGYMTPRHLEILDHNIEYTYDYTLIVGSLDEIRTHVYKNRPRTKPSEWTFATDRRHWLYRNTTDAGWPIQGVLDVALNPQKQATLISPMTFWNAKDAPALHLRAAFETTAMQGHVAIQPYEANDGRDWFQWGGERRPTAGPAIHAPFEIHGDGKMRTIEVDLSGLDRYRGMMTRLNVLLPKAKGRVRIESIRFLQPTDLKAK